MRVQSCSLLLVIIIIVVERTYVQQFQWMYFILEIWCRQDFLHFKNLSQDSAIIEQNRFIINNPFLNTNGL